MRPARQGSLDGLCGLYAVINALELAGVPSRRSLQTELFIQLAYGLGAGALLSAMHEGLETYDLVRAAAVAFRWLSDNHGIALEAYQPFEGRRFRSVRTYRAALTKLVEHPETAVIISFKKPGFAHWSVAQEIDEHQIRLRDSGGMRALRLADFTLEHGPYRFRPADTVVIQRR